MTVSHGQLRGGEEGLTSTPFWTWVQDKTPPAIHASRRERLRQMLPDGGMAVIFTNPEQVRNNDVDFQFRADSNFLYLTGFNEADAALVLSKSGFEYKGKTVHELLFCNARSRSTEVWNGYRFGPERAQEVLGFETVTVNRDWKEFWTQFPLGPEPVSIVSPEPELATRKLGRMIDEWTEWTKAQGDHVKVVRRLAPTLGTMRFVKDADEIRLLRRACEVSARSHIEVMKRVKPGIPEFSLSALMEYGFKRDGCEYLGYGNIVGSGPNTCILHYQENEKPLEKGDLLLMDCGGEYHGYTADVTRTVPVTGKFSTDQKTLYELVLAAQEAGIKACKVGANFNAAHEAASKILAEGLVKLGIIENEGQLGRYFMHGTSHSLGLDVHDIMPVNSTLQPGVVLTVEPGIYVPAGSPCDKRWWNIGIRIEDDILVTEKGPENLSALAPRRVRDIEKVMRGKKALP